MKRGQLNDLSVFVEVARSKGFRAAADKLKLAAGSVSESVQRFEDRLGVRLFDRTTRKIALTRAGKMLYERSLPAIQDLESAIRELDEQEDIISGTLRLSAPRSAGPFFLDSLVATYGKRYPETSIELIYDDQKVDLVSSAFDAAIRSNTFLEKDTFAVPIGPALKMSLVASPEYLEAYGMPRKPEDLTTHNGICFAFGTADKLAPWMFKRGNNAFSVMPKPRIVVNDLMSLPQYALDGLGIAYVYAKTTEHLVESGKLVSLLEKHLEDLPRYSINYLSKRLMTPKLRAFIDLGKNPTHT